MAVEIRHLTELEAATQIRGVERAAGHEMMAARFRFLSSREGLALARFAVQAQKEFSASGKAAGEAVRNGAIAGADVQAAASAAQRGPRRPA